MATPGFAEAGKGISGSVGMAPLPKAPSPPTPIMKSNLDTTPKTPAIPKISNVARQWARRAGDFMNRYPYAAPVLGTALVAGALSQSRDADDVLKMLPAIGASAGMMYGLRHARRLPANQRLASVLEATATGATAGWLPDVLKTGYDTFVENKKTSAAAQNVLQPAQSLFAGARQVALAPLKVSPLATLGVGSYFGLNALRRNVGDPIDRMARDYVGRRPKPYADLFRTYRQGANTINPYKITAPGSFRTHPHGGYAPKFG